jgi:hypothetical protein
MKDSVPVERITSKIYYSKSVRAFTECEHAQISIFA